MALIILSIFVIGYVYRKSWKTTSGSSSLNNIQYQKKHYESVIQNEDVEDPDAIISINSDSQSFYVLNQGKDMVRTHQQLKEKRVKEREEKERKKREKEQAKQKLEIDQVEELKDKLSKHMMEIRQLFGLSVAGGNGGEEPDGGESGGEGEDSQNNQRLLDQIFKIKMII